MSRPLVAIVGRPNVGKSMLFNKLTGKRMAIVEDTPGVTRDRIYGECDWNGRSFALVDTGGIEPGTNSEMLKFMRRQAEIAIETATVIIMVVDVTVGLTAADSEVAAMLKKSKKPVVLAVNKCDRTGGVNPEVYEFYSLGLGDPIEVSAVHGHGTGDILDACVENFPDTDEAYRGISSMLLLRHVVALLKAHHARVTNCDVTIVAQKPKLLPYIPQMRQNVADALELPLARVNIKATTTEKLGFEGEEKGISAQAVCMVQENG